MKTSILTFILAVAFCLNAQAEEGNLSCRLEINPVRGMQASYGGNGFPPSRVLAEKTELIKNRKTTIEIDNIVATEIESKISIYAEVNNHGQGYARIAVGDVTVSSDSKADLFANGMGTFEVNLEKGQQVDLRLRCISTVQK